MERMNAIAKTILAEAKKLGADYAQCTVSESEKKEFNVDGGQFSLMRTLFNRNIVITVLKEQRKGTVQINRFDEDSVKAAVADAVAASDSGMADPAWEFARGPVDESFEEGAPECDTDRLFMRTKELLETIREEHPKILMEQMITEHDAARTVFMSTNDVCYRTRSGCYSFGLMYSAHEGEKSSSFYGSDVTLKTLDKPVIECALIERELTAVEQQLDPMQLEGKFIGPAVLAPMALAEIVIETVMGSFAGDMSLIDGTSIWKDRLGQEVADPAFSLAFEPFSEDVVIGERYTGEGYPAENYDLIRNGKLTSFALSQYGANKTGGRRAGNQSGNMMIAPGKKTLEQLIGEIERGILVMRFSGGQPAPSGEFSGVAKNSFLIENGKIAGALSETMISGCVPEMLKQIRGISSDVMKDGNVSLPYIAFEGITISGK
jgi:PmbA protein